MVDSAVDLDAAEIRRLLQKLDAELARSGAKVAIYVVGGANIALTVDGTRTTTDIDTVVKAGYDRLVEAAAAVARTEPGLADDWINTEFTGGDNPTGGLFWQWFDHRGDDTPGVAYMGEALTVETASPQMMLALKTLANRDQDVADAITLMRLTGITTMQQVGRNLARFTGERIFRVQGTDGVYPRINPSFPHIFANLPPDLRAQQPLQHSDAPAPRCGAVGITTRNGVEIRRSRPCRRKAGHRGPHWFAG